MFASPISMVLVSFRAVCWLFGGVFVVCSRRRFGGGENTGFYCFYSVFTWFLRTLYSYYGHALPRNRAEEPMIGVLALP